MSEPDEVTNDLVKSMPVNPRPKPGAALSQPAPPPPPPPKSQKP